jgi:uncharacterized protein YcfL
MFCAFAREKMIQGAPLLAAAMVAAGCASTAPGPQAISSSQPAPAPARTPPMQPAPANDTRIIIDNALDRTLRVANVISSTGRDGLLKIQINVKNITDSPRWFSYRIEWFDKDGVLLRGASGDVLPWMLLAGETSSIVATAPAVTAKDFGVAFFAAAQ